MPVSVTLRYKDGVYATDSHVEHLVQLGSTETILSQLVSHDRHVPGWMSSRCTPSGNSDGEVLHDAVRQVQERLLEVEAREPGAETALGRGLPVCDGMSLVLRSPQVSCLGRSF